MTIDRASLSRRYEDLVDAELLRRLHSGNLTELAREVAIAELEKRGVSPEPPPTPPPPSAAPVPAEIAFPPDEFERNPYQAPRSAATDQARPGPNPVRRWIGWFWWAYIVIGALLTAANVLWLALQGTSPLSWQLVLHAAGFAGLAAWRLQRGLLHAYVWVALLAVLAANFAFGTQLLFRLVVEQQVLANTVLEVSAHLLTLPLLWGLLRYGFFSPWLWLKRPRAGVK